MKRRSSILVQMAWQAERKAASPEAVAAVTLLVEDWSRRIPQWERAGFYVSPSCPSFEIQATPEWIARERRYLREAIEWLETTQERQ